MFSLKRFITALFLTFAFASVAPAQQGNLSIAIAFGPNAEVPEPINPQ